MHLSEKKSKGMRGAKRPRFPEYGRVNAEYGTFGELGVAAGYTTWFIIAAAAVTALAISSVALFRLNNLPPVKEDVDITPGISALFRPNDTLFVSTVWPVGSDGTLFFTSIQAALTRATSFGPSVTNQVLIEVFPGTYTEDLLLTSSIIIRGVKKNAVTINGTITWFPGQGINLPQAGTIETVVMVDINYSGKILVDSFARDNTFGTVSFRMLGGGTSRNITMNFGGVSHQFTVDGSFITSNAFVVMTSGLLFVVGESAGAAAYLLNGTTVICTDSTLGPLIITGGPSFTATNCFLSDLLTTSGFVTLTGCSTSDLNLLTPATLSAFDDNIAGDVTGANGTLIFMRNSYIGGFLTVAATAYADIRSTQYSSLVGPGLIDRSIFTILGRTLTSGSNSVTLDPSYSITDYVVLFSQRSGTAQGQILTAKNINGFTVTVATTGLYDIDIVLA